MKKESEVYSIVNGNILLNSSDYVFIIQDGKYKIKRKDKLSCYDTVIMCSDCNLSPAIQLDKCSKKDVHDFTLCLDCLEHFVDLIKKGREDAKSSK
jgi:hypothetical protein